MLVRPGSWARLETEKFPANAGAALHRSAARLPDEVRPLDPPIQSPALFLPHLGQSRETQRNLLIFRDLYTSVERVDAVFADMDVPQHPGAALLVIGHDEIAYHKCYGLADLETQRPITMDSSFYLASISKQFTAAVSKSRYFPGFAPGQTHGDIAVLKAQEWVHIRDGPNVSLASMAAAG